MTPAKLDVLIAMFAYGGNGGVATIIPEVGLWVGERLNEMRHDERIGRVSIARYGDIPLTMERNRVVKDAIDGGYDVIMMLDSDNHPDLYLGKTPWAKPFWKSSFDFLYERHMRGIPSVICAPYCGPPPHPTSGGQENVYVFYAEDNETGNPESFFKFNAYDRNTAAQMRGIQEIAAGPTGVIVYSTSALQLMPVGKMSPSQVMDAYSKGELSQERALRLLRMQSWFFYEFTDQYQTRKASTEDVTNTREIQLAGIAKHKQPVVFCNWDAWAGHWKPKCVGMPMPIRMEHINDMYIEAVQNPTSALDEVRDLNFEVPDGDPHPQPEADPDPEDRLRNGVPKKSRTIFGRDVISVGHATGERDLQALHELVKWMASLKRDRSLRILEIGSWVGETAIAMRTALGPAGGTIFCVDHWEGSPTDWTYILAKSMPGGELFEYFQKNVGDDLGTVIKPIKGNSTDVADMLHESGPQNYDLIFIDGDHSYQSVLDDIQAWINHLAPHGIMCGHDWCDQFPEVERAAREALYPAEPKHMKTTNIWLIMKPDYDKAHKQKEGHGGVSTAAAGNAANPE